MKKFTVYSLQFTVRLRALAHATTRRSAAKQRGDTIIEVLIAMSFIGLALGASFGLANRAANTGRAAQEYAEATKIAESQIELLETYHNYNPYSYDTLHFGHLPDRYCLDSSFPVATAPSPAPAPERVSPSTADICMNTDGNNNPGRYSIEITPNFGDWCGTHRVRVTWDRINTASSEMGQIELFYRTGHYTGATLP